MSFQKKGKEKEREGEVGRGRRGGVEKRKGIVIGGMVLGLLMGCNNGGEDPQKVFLKSVVGLGNDFLNIFTSFGDVLGSTLGKIPKSQMLLITLKIFRILYKELKNPLKKLLMI